MMATKIFVNLPTKDLNKTIEFFTKLGFTFNPQFTDENATCMIIGEDIFVMLLVERFFKTFTNKEICDVTKDAEVIVALSAESREKVDQMMNRVLEAGGRESREPQDHGWIYGRSFQDIDGHLWEIIYMNQTALQKESQKQSWLRRLSPSTALRQFLSMDISPVVNSNSTPTTCSFIL